MRSPTAEHIFADWPNVETASAGINHDADNPVSPELLDWSDIIFVMEETQRSKLSVKFKSYLANKRVVCLNIPDNYKYMETSLIDVLMSKVPRYLPEH